MRRRALLAALLLAAPAHAQERPAAVPSRDVDVTYRMAGPGGELRERMRWSAAAQRLRLDPPSPGLWMVVDYRARRMALVQDEARRVVRMDAPAAGLPLAGAAGAAYTRRGADTVAGLACTEWETRDAAGAPVLACITEDGVMLRARDAAGRVVVEAAAIAYAAQPPALFEPPAGYAEMATPPAK